MNEPAGAPLVGGNNLPLARDLGTAPWWLISNPRAANTALRSRPPFRLFAPVPHSCVSQQEEQEGLRRAEILPGDAPADPEADPEPAPGAPNPIHMHFLDLRNWLISLPVGV